MDRYNTTLMVSKDSKLLISALQLVLQIYRVRAFEKFLNLSCLQLKNEYS